MLRSFLQMSGKDPELALVRNKSEFSSAVEDYYHGRHRYLHVSCHASDQEICTSTDSMLFDEFASIIKPAVTARRLFLSACYAVNDDLAKELFQTTSLLSLAGSSTEIRFHEAAIFWASFYYVMFEKDGRKMNNGVMTNTLQGLSTLFSVPIHLYVRDDGKKCGYKSHFISP